MDDKKQEAYTEIADELKLKIQLCKDVFTSTSNKNQSMPLFLDGFIDGMQNSLNIVMQLAYDDALKTHTIVHSFADEIENIAHLAGGNNATQEQISDDLRELANRMRESVQLHHGVQVDTV